MIEDLAEISWNSILSLQGETMEVFPDKASSFHVEAVFSNSTMQVDALSGMSVRTMNPHISYRPKGREIKVGDRIKRKDRLYRVEDNIPDGEGGFRLELHEIREKDAS